MSLDAFSLSGRVALVTGSSRGLGETLAEALARAGAHVVLNGRDEAALAANEERFREAGLSVSTRAFDVTDEAAAIAAVRDIAAEHGGSTSWSTMPGWRGGRRWRPIRPRTGATSWT